ncbi:hypothetical protein OJF2_51490 [Aquisphaera giovannonii]|uniref:DUF551 domain-containing protein n=1 Tax=Aquisphaera giovannonii TaxID=406548 RepID=A0A5B9W8Y3_9BACT|nr:DUF551 domain-containing protein [Aquisphaera giovannonii]QEH36565.1 hypothetical protein OJF2_51490 [Aquisphaera giovannonii]
MAEGQKHEELVNRIMVDIAEEALYAREFRGDVKVLGLTYIRSAVERHIGTVDTRSESGLARELAEALELLLPRAYNDQIADSVHKRIAPDLFADVEKARAALAKHRATALHDDGWQPIETAPKGEITEDVGCRGVSEWFIGLQSDGDVRKIRRLPTMHSYDFADTEQVYYAASWFTHWMPLPKPPAAKAAAEVV